jgi:hypothetical protein
MSINNPTPRIAESFIGNDNKPTWKQLKCIFALKGGKPYDKPKTRQEASQVIQQLKTGNHSQLGKGNSSFQLVNDLAELKSEVNSEKVATKPTTKPTKVKATKINRATLRQKMCIYAISMSLWNSKEKAKKLSNLVKSRDEASETIQKLKSLQS